MPTTTMKAAFITACGGLEVFQPGDYPKPVIGTATQVLVRLMAAGVNPVDTKMRQGYHPIEKFPAILGCEAAGIVEETGSSVQKFQVGDEVYFTHSGLGKSPGNYAEYALVDERHLVRKPDRLSMVEAAALPLVFITAWESLCERAQIKPGQTVLVHAGAGGVGHVAIQIAKHLGAKVMTTVGSLEKAELVEKLGADKIILYKQTNFVEEVLEYTSGAGADVVMDNVGGKLFQDSFPAVRHYGDIVTLLMPAPDTDWTAARMRNLRISLELMSSPALFNLVEAFDKQREILESADKLVELGQLNIHISKTLPLEQAAEAHRLIETGSSTGKIVLTIDE